MPTSSPVFTLQVKRDAITAIAREVDGEFTVLEGSQARREWTGAATSYKALHAKLAEEKVLAPEPDGKRMRFTRDYVFASPSAAGAAITGRQTNGRTDWKTQDTGISFGSWQAEGIEQFTMQSDKQ